MEAAKMSSFKNSENEMIFGSSIDSDSECLGDIVLKVATAMSFKTVTGSVCGLGKLRVTIRLCLRC